MQNQSLDRCKAMARQLWLRAVSAFQTPRAHISVFSVPILAGIFPIHLLANGMWYQYFPSFVSLALHNKAMLWHYQSCLYVSLGPHQLAARLHQY